MPSFSLSLSLSLFYQVLLVFELQGMASSSSSHKQNRESNAFSEMEPAGNRAKVFESSRLFDVFINHRGPDVKETLATELYNSLRQSGIEVFLDSREKELGKLFTSIIETAIRSAKVHIAIFSPRYAESPWCLAELLLMIESKVKIIPVFYEVEPWELRHIEKGRYAGAFIKYEKKGRYLQKLNEWKEALQTLSFIAGVEFHSFSDYKTIIAAVEKEVLQSRRCLHVAKYPVGLNNLVEDFERRCLDELVRDFENQCGLAEKKNRPNVVGIFGMGGVGKTTLAKELFNRKLSEYSRTSFLFDVREASARGELPRLQSKLVEDLFHTKETFTSIEEGTSSLNNLLPTIPLNFLIVVDDIDHVEQLEALLIMDTLNKSGNSLIIVTTRDVGVMISAEITIGYPLKGMDRGNGRQLFCWHAFDQPFPHAQYEALVDQFVDVCGGLPLSLLVLGRLVHGRDLKFWELHLLKARVTLPRDVKQRLRISFDALEDEEKQVFMDMACFFLGEPKRIAERILEGSGWGAQTALQTLKDKCLIEEMNYYYRMHDHLRDLGREMALELSPPHRLWRPRYLQSMELMGLQNILAKTNTRRFHSFVDNSTGCTVTFFLGQSDSCVQSSASFLWLQLEYPLSYYDYEETTLPPSSPSLPAWIPLQHLQGLEITNGLFETLWENHTEIFPHQHQLSTSCRGLQKVSVSGDPIQLRELIIRHCPKLEELPSLSRLNCMEKIEIVRCHNLKTITLPTALTSLSITSCRDLQRVSGNGDLVKLRELIVSECPELEELPSLSIQCRIVIDVCEKLKKISGIEELPALQLMRLGHCSNALIRNCIHNLKSVPSQGMMMIGRAVGGAESCFNKDLFCDCIGVDEVIENSYCGTNGLLLPNTNAVVVCYLVIVDSSTLVDPLSEILHLLAIDSYSIEMRRGEWIITIFSSGASASSFFEDTCQIEESKYGIIRCGIIKKSLHIKVNGEDRKVMGVYHTIADKLHKGD